jgi:hypothetical protein
VGTHVRAAHASINYGSFEEFNLYAIDHFQNAELEVADIAEAAYNAF